MPWFCGSSKKRHNKSKVGTISNESATNSNVLTNGRPSFTVVLQDFIASVSDELSAHRGQVLEALFTDREWIYVRDINGKCGYVPQIFCYPLDAISDNTFQKSMDYASLHRPRPKSLQIDIAPVSRGSDNSVSVNHTQEQRVATEVNLTPVARRASRATPDSTLSQTPDSQRPTHRRTLSSSSQRNPASDTTEMSATQKLTTNSIRTSGQALPAQERINASPVRRLRTRRQSCPPAREMVLPNESFQYTPYSANRAKPVKRSVSMNEGAQGRVMVRPRRVSTVSQTLSYQEPVHSTTEQVDTARVSSNDRLNSTPEEPLGVQRHSSSDSPGCTRKNCDCSRRPKPNSRRNKLRRQRAIDYDSSDDVFLPNSEDSKPFGIFHCLQDYQPTFEGEIIVKKNELIIVLDYGRGEWAWILTSHHVEGLVPKRILSRYDSDRGVSGARQVDASTQTELVVSGAVRQVASSASAGTQRVRQVSTASNASMGTSTARQVSSASSASGPSVCGITTPLEATSTPQSAQTAVIAPSTTQTAPSPKWFSFTDSLERPVSQATSKSSTPVTNRRLPKSAPVTPITPTTRQPRRLIANTDRGKSFSSRALSNKSANKQGVPALTAAKDYQPRENSKSCLTLKKGDVLTPQAHMHFPKGWMWVWHAEQKRFGYVPNSSVAYTYPVARKNRTATVEDAV